MPDSSIIIIGGGFAGLAAGIYAQMNGYRTQIFEMHDKPGGLCTAWKRQGYTIDGCIHWLAGSSPNSSMYYMWRETGILPGRQIVDLEEYARFECADGRVFIFYSDVDRLEKQMLEFSPEDAVLIREFISGIRLCLAFDQPSPGDPLLVRIKKGIKMGLFLARRGRQMQRWMKTSIGEFAARFKEPALSQVLTETWGHDFSIFFLLFTCAWMHRREAGYPIGGSMPMSEAMAKRYLELGGTIHYRQRVEKILVEEDSAVGVRLVDGSEHRADRVISAADGHSTIFEMLDGRYTDPTVREPYEKWRPFPPLLFISLGVNRLFQDIPCSYSGISFPLPAPVKIGDAVYDRLPLHIFNQDPTLAPAGKTVLIAILTSRYDYWQQLAQDRKAYEAHKEEIAKKVIEALETRFPGIRGQVEMTDVATPLTFERYTGNWQGSFEGWLITPQNSDTMIRPMSQTLPGLKNFYMSGQWVQPGGGLPSGVMTSRRLLQRLCRQDGNKFRIVFPPETQ